MPLPSSRRVQNQTNPRAARQPERTGTAQSFCTNDRDQFRGPSALSLQMLELDTYRGFHYRESRISTTSRAISPA
jgi:hypothetical protein